MRVVTLLSLGAAFLWPYATAAGTDPRPRAGEAPAFQRAQSAALFVGVQRFTHDSSLSEVRYAVDDAVDLAFVLALDERVRLVDPGRVVLALSGEPQKEESKQNLNALLAAGATRAPATQSDILTLLERQARAAGPNGVLVLGFATHGVNQEGTHYLLTASSLLRYAETSISENKIRDIASHSEAARSLIFIDACRQQLTSDARAGEADPRSVSMLIHRMSDAAGQVVMSAAAAGEYAYDDDARRNGVFTAAVIDGLRCEAAVDGHGLVTVETLAAYVEERVLTWVRKHRDASARRATQINYEGAARRMPLATCLHARSHAQPASVNHVEGSFNVFNDAGIRLWGGRVRGKIARADVADLDGDGRNEVLVGVADGDDSGKIVAFAADGKRLWSANTTTSYNYLGSHGGKMAVTDFITADLDRRGKRQVVAIAIDGQGWYQSRLCVFEGDGTLRGSYWHPGHLHKVIVGAPTADAAPRIIAAGVNNDLQRTLSVRGHVSIVIVLDPANVTGEAPPYFGKAGKGTHLWYAFLLPPERPIERLEIVDFKHDDVNTISIWIASTALFLDFSGKVIAAEPGEGANTALQFGLAR
jgi:hypothetical protein